MPPTADFTDSTRWRDPGTMQALLDAIAARVTRPWRIMEVCGGQTWTLSRYRLEQLLPREIEMIHGPGCPVCVTPAATVDAAVALAMRPEVIFCSFGDMLRVPGTTGSLLRARSEGADVRLLYSPLDAIEIARENHDRQVVFFAIGFETTMPVYALMIRKAMAAGIGNLSLLTSLYTVPPVVTALHADPDCRVDALLAAGHVCAVTGTAPYRQLASDLRMPVVITGFEPVDMLLGILRAVEMLESGANEMANAYARVVNSEHGAAWQGVNEVFRPSDICWRGLGNIPLSGMELRPEYEAFDARRRFALTFATEGGSQCIAHRIMKGLCRPEDCERFGRECTPEHPVGAPMVSAEGVCAAHFRYRN